MASGIPLFKKELAKIKDKVAIAFPDNGAYKRFGKLFKNYPIVVCGKVRKGKERVVTIT